MDEGNPRPTVTHEASLTDRTAGARRTLAESLDYNALNEIEEIRTSADERHTYLDFYSPHFI